MTTVVAKTLPTVDEEVALALEQLRKWQAGKVELARYGLKVKNPRDAWPEVTALLSGWRGMQLDVPKRASIIHQQLDELLHVHRKMTLLAAWFWQALLRFDDVDEKTAIEAVQRQRARNLLGNIAFSTAALQAYALPLLGPDVSALDRRMTLELLFVGAWLHKEQILQQVQGLHAKMMG